MNKPRIAIVTSCMDNRPARGTALVARRFVERLEQYRDQFDFTLIHHNKTEDPIYQQYPELIIPNVWFPFGRTMCNEMLFWFTHRFSRAKFDVVHYLQPRVWPSYLLSHTKRIVLTPHDAGIMLNLSPIGMGERLFRFTNRRLNWRMNNLIAVSEFAKQEIADTYHIDDKKITVVYNGVDNHMQPVEQTTSTHTLLKTKYGITQPYILSVGRMTPHKNILTLLDAYAALRAKGCAESLVLVGGRHLSKYSSQVEQKINDLYLQTHVHIAPYIEPEDLPLVYSAAAVLVYPSLHEGFGLPMLEAMACHTPVVASNATSLPEIAGNAALLCDPTNTEAITDALHHVLTDTHMQQALVSKRKKRVQQFTGDRSTQAIISLYKTLTA